MENWLVILICASVFVGIGFFLCAIFACILRCKKPRPQRIVDVERQAIQEPTSSQSNRPSRSSFRTYSYLAVPTSENASSRYFEVSETSRNHAQTNTRLPRVLSRRQQEQQDMENQRWWDSLHKQQHLLKQQQKIAEQRQQQNLQRQREIAEQRQRQVPDRDYQQMLSLYKLQQQREIAEQRQQQNLQRQREIAEQRQRQVPDRDYQQMLSLYKLQQQETAVKRQSQYEVKQPQIVQVQPKQDKVQHTQEIWQPKELNLHGHNMKQAMSVFKRFLASCEVEYKNSNFSRHCRFIKVITGRGKHSPDRIPVIKPAVENYLKAHNYTFVWSNPGMVQIDLRSKIYES